MEHLRDDDELVICEINERFMTALKKTLSEMPEYDRHKERISFFQGPVQELPQSGKFDLIVCAIPFLNFELEMVREIFGKFSQISSAETVLTYYEYMGL